VKEKLLNKGNQIHNFISSSGSGTVINYGSSSDFLTSYVPVPKQPLSWQIISGAPPLFSGPVAFFASFWSAGFEKFRQPPALVSHWLGGFAGSEPTLLGKTPAVSQSTFIIGQYTVLGL
jgi:hypothetical protein